jgi:hypothetical protein
LVKSNTIDQEIWEVLFLRKQTPALIRVLCCDLELSEGQKLKGIIGIDLR